MMIPPHNTASMVEWGAGSSGQPIHEAARIWQGLHEQRAILDRYNAVFRLNA